MCRLRETGRFCHPSPKARMWPSRANSAPTNTSANSPSAPSRPQSPGESGRFASVPSSSSTALSSANPLTRTIRRYPAKGPSPLHVAMASVLTLTPGGKTRPLRCFTLGWHPATKACIRSTCGFQPTRPGGRRAGTDQCRQSSFEYGNNDNSVVASAHGVARRWFGRVGMVRALLQLLDADRAKSGAVSKSDGHRERGLIHRSTGWHSAEDEALLAQKHGDAAEEIGPGTFFGLARH